MRTAMIAIVAAAGAMALSAGSAAASQQGKCDKYARNYANSYGNPGASAVGGAMAGGFLGAGIAGITGGNVGQGAALGAGLGLFGGLASQGPRWQQLYTDAFNDCMYGGGGPQPVYNPGPSYDEGSQGWYQACAAKYKSFQWDGPYEGYFKGYDGQWHQCQL